MDSQDTGSNQAAQDAIPTQPDPQTLYQQHLAHWQAAFQEYWKCMASQGAAMPQQWAAQAMMGGGYGGMPYFGGGMMNPYGGMMGTAPPVLPQDTMPAASMPLATGPCEAATAAPPAPVATATTATSSQAGLHGNGMDSDADSRLTADEDPGELLLSSFEPQLAVSSPLDCLPLQQQETVEPAVALEPEQPAVVAVGPAAVSAPAAAAAPAVGSLPAVTATVPLASRGPAPALPAAVPAPLAAPTATVVLPTTSIAAAAGATVGPVGLPVMGLAQPSALAVSQAAVQLSNMTDHAGGLSHSVLTRHHSGTASLFGEDGQLLDEKDLKRLRRKQSNRESARRSRLRKQAENDTLQQRLHDCEAQRNSLIAENAALKQRMEQLTLLVARLSQDKVALLNQVKGLGGQVSAELEATPLAAIPTITAETLQQQIAAAAAVTQAVAASQAAVVPAVSVPAPTATLAAVTGLPEQLHSHNIQLQSIAVTAPQQVVAANGGSAEMATAILASA